jgi:hypothetical protein
MPDATAHAFLGTNQRLLFVDVSRVCTNALHNPSVTSLNPRILVQGVTILNCTPEVPGSNLGRDITTYPFILAFISSSRQIPEFCRELGPELPSVGLATISIARVAALSREGKAAAA